MKTEQRAVSVLVSAAAVHDRRETLILIMAQSRGYVPLQRDMENHGFVTRVWQTRGIHTTRRWTLPAQR